MINTSVFERLPPFLPPTRREATKGGYASLASMNLPLRQVRDIDLNDSKYIDTSKCNC